jgi:dihydroorotase
LDIGLLKGKIEAIEKDIPGSDAAKTIDVSNRIVTPGIVDLHTHVYTDVTEFGIHSNEAGVYSGVTTVVDTGSSGAFTFPGFKKIVVEPAITDVYCFLNFGVIGLVSTKIGELYDDNYYDTDATIKVIQENRGIIRGIKIRAITMAMGKLGMDALKKAKEASNLSKVPLMVHIGETRTSVLPPFPLEVVLSYLEEGDILTHCLSARAGAIFVSSQQAIEAAKAAIDRGVYFDVGHGLNNLSFDVARKAMSVGFDFDSISTDMHIRSKAKTVFDMATTMTKFLHLGLSLEDVIRKTTIGPAKLIKKEDEIGSLRTGRSADISVFEIREGSWNLLDSENKVEKADHRIIPVLTVKSGKVFELTYSFPTA